MTVVGYLATIPAANLLTGQVGVAPVGFGLLAPAGIFLAGLAALALRDLVLQWDFIISAGQSRSFEASGLTMPQESVREAQARMR